jgi:ABC-2 type transport system permease protein
MSSELATGAELAPSETRVAAPVAARVAGAFGLCAVTAGAVSVIASQYRPVILGQGGGTLMAALGLTGLFLHAVRDTDAEVRRGYGAFAALLLLAAAVVSVVPGAPSGGAEKSVGYYLLPWGAAGLVLALLFAVPFARHEDDPRYLRLAEAALAGVGGLLCVGSVLVGVAKPDTLIGPGAVLAIVGLGYVAAYLTTADTNEGRGYWTAVALGAVGAAALFVAFAQTVFPSILHDGPAALRNVRQAYDKFAIAGRLVVIGLALAGAFYGATRLGRGGGSAGLAIRLAAALAGVGTAAVFAVGSFTAPWTANVPAYLVPYGLLLGGVGLLYLMVAAGILSDAPLVVLTRRELAAFFYSPIAYMVLFGMAASAAIGYLFFLNTLTSPTAEPIVQRYPSTEIVGIFQVVFLVPALTMRLFSEEKRTGTLEVLLTAPVNEPAVVLSKFLAAWFFFLICWVPTGLYLVALRSAGGTAFDYRPMLSYYLVLAATGAGFIGMGLFFSSLTKNQVVAAVLTFAGMMFLLLMIWAPLFPFLPDGLKAGLGKLNFYSLWSAALGGQLSVPDVLIHLSLAVFWLFLTVKVLDVRKWG